MENKKEKVIEIDSYYIFNCPHCMMDIIVNKNQLNCKIFRCGVYKKNGNQIPPHSKKEVCVKLFENNLIYGCGKPFMYKNGYVEPCDYI